MQTNVSRSPRAAAVSCEIQPIGAGDTADLKRLFLKLHMYNASLDPRFALSEDWTQHFDTLVEELLHGQERLALLAREAGSGRAAGFALAKVHQDSPMWRHREWVELEALYVEREWRGSGLADQMMASVSTWAVMVGQPMLQLYVTASNTRAIRFYEGQGFGFTQAIMRRVLSA